MTDEQQPSDQDGITVSAGAGLLSAGAATVDITPSDLTELNPVGGGSFDGVHDPLALRALVLSDGGTEVALVTTDLIEAGDMNPMRKRIEQELGIPADHVIITASHTHSAPRLGRVSPGALAHDGGPESAIYTAWVYDRMIEALRSARAHARPARLGYGTGHADVNVNRDLFADGKWRMGFNPDGPSDKTVRIVKIESTDGVPIAVLLNYAVHSVVTLGSRQVSADLAGAAAAEIERHVGNGAVALWTLGSVGDQNPRIQLGFPGHKEPHEVTAAWAACQAQGIMLAAEVIRVLDLIDADDATPKLGAQQRVHPCPVKRGVDVMSTMRQADVDTVDLRLSVILLGSVVLCGVSGEVTTAVAQRIYQRSPLQATIVVSMANDRIGYLPEDEAFSRGTFEAKGSPIQAGHAENAIVGGLADMVRSTLV